MTAPEFSSFPYVAVVLTGGSSGIGKSFIKHLGNVGRKVLICNLSRTAPGSFSPNLDLCHIPTDLRNGTARAAAAASVVAALEQDDRSGPILMINNAGIGCYGEFHAEELHRQLEMMEVNLTALIDLTGRLLPLLRHRTGAILNVASITAFQPTPFMATYGATKAFLLHWGYALRHELKDQGVAVLTVCPGSTATAFHARAGMSVGVTASRIGQSPDAVVTEAMRALARGKPHVVTGRMNRVMTTFAGWLPFRWTTRLSARALSHLKSDRMVPR